MLHLLACEAYLIAYDGGFSRVEFSLVFGNLEGAQGLSVGRMEPLGVVEADQSLLALELYGAEQRAGWYDGGVTVVVVQSQDCKAVTYRLLVARVNVVAVANVAAYSHSGVWDA